MGFSRLCGHNSGGMWDKLGFVWDRGGGYRTNLNMVILAFYIFSHAQAIFSKEYRWRGIKGQLGCNCAHIWNKKGE